MGGRRGPFEPGCSACSLRVRAARQPAGGRCERDAPRPEEEAMVEFPKQITLKDGTRVTLKRMTSRDRDALHALFERLPEEDTKFLKDDVRKPEVIDAWCRDIAYARVFPLLAEVDGVVVADATLHRRTHGWLKHVGEIRFIVDPAYRRKGLGAHLIEELILYAIAEGLEKLVAEVVAEETAAIRALERFGFKPVAVLPGLVKDHTGMARDLHILVLGLGTALLPDWYYF
jgi:RimJ/RimL family protein N-acetyltransferase